MPLKWQKVSMEYFFRKHALKSNLTSDKSRCNWDSMMTLRLMTLFYLFILSCSKALGLDNTLVLPDPSILRGLEWLEKQREPDYGFQQHTHEAITALQLGNLSSWFSPDSLSSQLTIKQMDVEILLNLLRRHESPPSPRDFALYSIALSSLCRDPKQFYGHDLISNIIHQEILMDLEFAVSSLAICTSGNHVRKRQIRRLLDITEQNKQISVETLSMVIIALNCIIQDHRNRNLNHYLIHPMKKLGEMQKKDGSFGDLKSSALAIQALQATDPGARHWNKVNATSFIRQQQNENGSFGQEDVLYATILVILALGPQGLVDIRNFDCHNEKLKDWPKLPMVYSGIILNKSLENITTGLSKAISVGDLGTSNWTEINEPEKSSDDDVIVFYTLWVGSNVTEIYSINITTENNDTFYNVMQLAAQKDNHFSFLSTEWPNGHYVHTLAGYKEEPMSYHYWLLYRLPMLPDPALPPPNQYVAPVGVDELLVEDGDHFLFWYKKL